MHTKNIIKSNKMEINDDFKKIFSFIKNTNETVFITGKAGTGKSTFLEYFKENSRKKVVITAPTGIAALNVSGQTIHSFFGLSWGLLKKDDIYPSRKREDLLKAIDTLVIDEVSMVRVDLLEAIDQVFRINIGKDIPFGGKQVIFIGDLFQLSPVIKETELNKYFEPRYGGHYFFNADVFNEIKPVCFELTKIYRQKDKDFILLLDRIRREEMTSKDLILLNSRVQTDKQQKQKHLILGTTNRLVDNINREHLEEIKSKGYEYEAIIRGEFRQDSYPTYYNLKLKKGAQVMLVKNDKYKRWVNGTLGVVDDINEIFITVNIDGNKYEVLQETWEQYAYDYDSRTNGIEKKIVGEFIQYPIKLAWAVTIHKSQGHTFDNIIIDLGRGAFAHGQVYVGLSRCRTLEGISLERAIRPRDIIFDKSIYGYMDKFIKC